MTTTATKNAPSRVRGNQNRFCRGPIQAPTLLVATGPHLLRPRALTLEAPSGASDSIIPRLFQVRKRNRPGIQFAFSCSGYANALLSQRKQRVPFSTGKKPRGTAEKTTGL